MGLRSRIGVGSESVNIGRVKYGVMMVLPGVAGVSPFFGVCRVNK